MQYIQRTGIPLAVNIHQEIVVICDAAFSNTDQEHCDQKPDRIAADQQHDKAQSHRQLDQDIGHLDSQQQRQIACQKTGQDISHRLDRQKRSAHLIGKGVIRLEVRQDRSQHDQDQSQRHIGIEQIQDHTQFSFPQRYEKSFLFHKYPLCCNILL